MKVSEFEGHHEEKSLKGGSPWRRHHLLALLILGVFLDAAAVTLHREMARRMLGNPPTSSGDAIAVLFADFGPLQGLSKESQRRVRFAGELYRSGVAPRVLCVGGYRGSGAHSGAVLMKKALVGLGVPENRVVVTKPSYDSTTNLGAIGVEAEREGWRTGVVVVSSANHLFRLRYTARSLKLTFPAIYAPYLDQDAVPPVGVIEAWTDVHYEWVAWLLAATLPVEGVQAIAARLRGVGD